MTQKIDFYNRSNINVWVLNVEVLFRIGRFISGSSLVIINSPFLF